MNKNTYPKQALVKTDVSKSALLIILFFMISCDKLEPPKQKPFVIVGKNSTYYSSQNRAEYYYQDAKGNRYAFTDANNLYKVGDTIR